MGLTLRKDLSRKLTIQEMDNNFTYLESISKSTSGNLIDASTTTWDYSQFSIARWTIGGNRTLQISNLVANKGGLIYLTQDATGGRIPSLPGIKPTGIQFSASPGNLDVLGFFYDGISLVWSIANYGTVLNLPTLISPTLTASPFSTTQINLSVATVSSATSYKFERSADSGFVNGNTTLQNSATTSYSDTGLVASTTYYYRCTAQASGYNDGISSIVPSTTLAANQLANPVLTASASGTSSVILTSTLVNNATGYKFERSISSGFTNSVTTLQDTATTSYNDVGLTPGAIYYYKVTAHAVGFIDGVSATQSASPFIAETLIFSKLQNATTPIAGNLVPNGSLPSGGTVTKKLPKINGNRVFISMSPSLTTTNAGALILCVADDSNYLWNSATNSTIAAVFQSSGVVGANTASTAGVGANYGSISANDLLGFEVSGNNLLIIKSTDGGTTFNTMGTLTGALASVSANMVIKGILASGGSNIVGIKGLGVV